MGSVLFGYVQFYMSATYLHGDKEIHKRILGSGESQG